MIDPIQIKIKDDYRGFHFNNYALVELGKVLQVEPMQANEKLMEIASTDAVTALTAVLYSGFYGFLKAEGDLFPKLKLSDVTKAIAVCGADDFTAAWDAFKTATGVSDFIENLPKEEDPEKKSL